MSNFNTAAWSVSWKNTTKARNYIPTTILDCGDDALVVQNVSSLFARVFTQLHFLLQMDPGFSSCGHLSGFTQKMSSGEHQAFIQELPIRPYQVSATSRAGWVYFSLILLYWVIRYTLIVFLIILSIR